MSLQRKTYISRNQELTINVELYDDLRSIRWLDITWPDADPDDHVALASSNRHLIRTQVQHSSRKGFHITGSLCLEPDEHGDAFIRADLRFGFATERPQTLNGMILHFSSGLPADGSAADGDDPDAPASPGQGGGAVFPSPVVPPDAPEHRHDEHRPKEYRHPGQEAAREDLFPYVYLRKWPSADEVAPAPGFARFPGPSASARFYAALSTMRAPTREQMQAEALLYRSGKSPYDEDVFVPDCSRLFGLISLLPKVAALARPHATEPMVLIAAIAAVFGVPAEAMPATLATQDYVRDIERVWESYFAQLILDDNPDQVAACTRLLLTDHLLRALFAAAPAAVTPAMLAQLLDASIVLPDALFPLPPGGGPQPASIPLIKPCAIGELQMVRHALLRYEAGDLAHVENIMPGERREVRRVRVAGHHAVDSDHSDNADTFEQGVEGMRQSLAGQSREALAEKTVYSKYVDFDTTYGPPTQAKLNGSWTEWTRQGSVPGSEERTEFARQVLDRGVARMSRLVHRARARASYMASEESVTSVIDNSASRDKLLCAFRWLNKVYRASVVRHDHRLMVEFTLAAPAAAWQTRCLRAGTPCGIPASLATNGIASFAEITPDNFAALAAIYEVEGLTAAPAPLRYLSATLCDDEQKLLAIPDGYRVKAAVVSVVAGQPDGGVPVILVGGEQFSAGDDPAKPRSFGEDGTIALAIVGRASPAPVPPPAPAPTPALSPLPVPVPAAPSNPRSANLAPPALKEAGAVANVVVTCEPGAALLDEWRIRTYDALLRGYQRQVKLAAAEGARPAALERREVRDELRRGCTRMLLARAAALRGIGSDATPAVPDPWQLQFLGDLFEWQEMLARFYGIGSGGDLLQFGASNDSVFTEFLNADVASVLLPVARGQELALLYFLSNGYCWGSDPDLAPVDATDVALVQELKRLRTTPRGQPVGQAWEVVVPTAMQVQDADFALGAAAQEQAA